MSHSLLRIAGLLGGAVALAAACSATATHNGFTTTQGEAGSGSGASGTSSSGSTSTGAGSSGTGGQVTISVTTGSTTTGSGTACAVVDMNADMDHDGWSPAQGDCNDCDPNVNPGAVDVPGDPNMVDSDCDGKYDPPVACDTSLMLDDVNASDGAKAIELCQFTTLSPPTPQQKVWGVITSSYVRADGTAFTSPGLQVGIQNGWGPNVHPQGGTNMLAMSSGHARTASQSGACGSMSCEENANSTAPAGFPQDNPNCPPSPDIYDDVGLQLDIRTPTNATGYSFNFKFYSMEFPYWVCNNYNDQFIALVTPAPAGSVNGNISFDSMHNAVSVNLGFFDVCDPTQSSQYAAGCFQNCPSPPSPYCPSGTAQLSGTGFDTWDSSFGGAGATSWLKSQAPVTGGSTVSIRFAIWDTGDQEFDSTVLVDNFQWIATKGTVVVSTNPEPNPQ
jgi:hypothetical protein